MDVALCGHQNPAGAAFCSTCGSPLAASEPSAHPTCLECGGVFVAGASFCSTCGAAAPTDAALSFEGERRQLTVMFCDLVGSTDLGALLDPEQFREVVDAYYRLSGDRISANGGYVANYIGDGILAYFGYPQALEDAATRAVLAGLDLQRAVAEANAAGGVGPGISISVRVGVHTGVVVIDEVGAAMRRETHALGDSMNVAARVEASAAPGDVYLTEATLRLVDDRFAVESRGLHDLKGVAEPLRLYRAVGADDSADEPTRRRGSAGPFVGRAAELGALRTAWASASRGNGQVVTVIGEPGVGKSRLLHRLRDDVATSARWVHGQATAYGQTTPFGVIGALIEQDLIGRGASSPAERRAALELDGGSERARLVGPLVGAAEVSAPHVVTAESDRRRTIEHLVTWLRDLAASRPAVLVLEDLHWADPSSVEVLTALAAEVAQTTLLVIVTSRPADAPSFATGPSTTVLKLERLDAAETRSLIADAVGRATSAKVIDELVARSDGIPLFAEELARTVAAGRDEHLATVPPTLHDSLMARVDRLGPAKPVAQVAAVLGREFSSELLERVAGLDRQAIERALDVLVEADIVERRPPPARELFTFRHALVQQAAYDALLLRDRRNLHSRAADALSDADPIEVAAQHLSLAGQHERAADAWSTAGTRAAQRLAWMEARAHLTNAVAAVRELPETPETTQRELDLELQLLRSIEMAGGFADQEAVACIERARALSERLGDPDTRVSVLFGMWSTTLSSGRVEGSLQLAEEMVRIADASLEPAHRRAANIAMAGTSYNLGRYSDAHLHASAVLDGPGYADEMERGQALMYGTLTGVVTLRTEPTQQWMHELSELARSDGADLIAAIIARVGAAVAGVWGRDHELVDEMAELMRANAEAFGMPMFAAWADIYGGWSSVLQGRDEAGLERIVEGLQAHLELEQALGLNHSLALLAEARLELGQLDEALEAIEEGLAATPVRSQPLHASELRRLRGAVHDAAGRHELVEADLRSAHDLAAGAGCELIAVRAATHLAVWSRRQGRDHGSDLLVAVLDRIDRTNPHPDVVAARAAIESEELL